MKLTLIRRFSYYLNPYWKKEVLLLFLMVLSSIGTLASPYALKIIIDKVFPSQDYTLLLQLLGALVIINIFRLLVGYSSDYLFEWISNHITRDIRRDLFTHLLHLPVEFYEKKTSGDLVHRVSSEVNSIQNVLTGTLVRLINSICTILGLAVMLSILNFHLFIIAMCVMPFIFINTKYYQPKIQHTVKLSREKDAGILSFLMERFSNIKLIKTYVSYDFEKEKLDNHLSEQINLNLKNVRLTATTRNITSFFSMLIPILILGIGGKEVITGVMTVGALVAFMQYMARIFDPFRNLMGLYFDAIRAFVSMERIFDLLSYKTERGDGKRDFKIKNNITFKNIDFSYDKIKVLDHFNFNFSCGKKYALVGSSGCGKSTLLSLLCRFYTPQEGNIYINEIDITEFDIETLRSKIAFITQDNQLFHDTLENNIKYGNNTVSCEEINRISQQVNIADYVNQLPDKFHTLVGDQGVGLSGGQKQRIAIARALLKKANILILDEATSALDSESEKYILDNICKLYPEKTVIIISHRLSAIREVDEIICMEKGKVIEHGKHTYLLNLKGFYWNLFKNQVE